MRIDLDRLIGGKPVFVPWPRYPEVTKAGRISAAKTAGKTVPWLSRNVVNNLHPRVYEGIKILWRQAAHDAAIAWMWDTGSLVSDQITPAIILNKRTKSVMDSYAVLEGVKPLIDGFVQSGLIPDDTPRFIMGGFALAEKAPSQDTLGCGIGLIPTDAITIGDTACQPDSDWTTNWRPTLVRVVGGWKPSDQTASATSPSSRVPRRSGGRRSTTSG